MDFDEALLLERMSVSYDNIPIIKEGDFHKEGLENVRSILSALKEEEKAVIHCAGRPKSCCSLNGFFDKKRADFQRVRS